MFISHDSWQLRRKKTETDVMDRKQTAKWQTYKADKSDNTERALTLLDIHRNLKTLTSRLTRKTSSGWIRDLNVGAKTITLVAKNVGANLCALVIGKEVL